MEARSSMSPRSRKRRRPKNSWRSALDGRNGSLRWTWRCVERDGNHTASCGIDPIALNSQGKDSICVACNDQSGETRIVILDPQGREVARRTLPRASHSRNDNSTVSDLMMDLDGDGRDELVVWYDRRFRAWGRDLKEHWSRPSESWPLARFVPPSHGGSGTLVLTPATAIDGVTGQVRWAYKSPPQWWRFQAHGLLDPGNSTRLPLLISTNQPTTIGRHALPTTSSGDYLPPSGNLVPPGLTWNDPRWTRPLPWVTLIVRDIGVRGFLAHFGLALVNVILPLTLLRLTARAAGASAP